VEVSTAEQAKELTTANPVVVFGFFTDKEKEKAKTFLNIAGAVDDQIFAIVSDEKVIKELEAQDEDVVLFKNVSPHFMISNSNN
jgi:protein disulfide-isomerase A1